MIEPSQSPQPESEATLPAPAVAPISPVKQSLGAVLSENYDALQEDLRQANELAAGLEAELAGKSKEVLHLKFLFEQTKSHLGHMQDSIAAMRKERHKLANDSMRATGLEIMLTKMTAERDRLKKELEGVLEGLAAENAQKGLRFDKRDRQIAELTFELMGLRQELADLKRMHPRPAPIAPAPPARALPLKTSAEQFVRDDADLDGVEIVPTERVAGGRTRA